MKVNTTVCTKDRRSLKDVFAEAYYLAECMEKEGWRVFFGALTSTTSGWGVTFYCERSVPDTCGDE